MTTEIEDLASLPQLKFIPPRRTPPPQHLADLGAKGAQELCSTHGISGYRVDQVGRHWYSRLSSDFDSYTDLLGIAIVPNNADSITDLQIRNVQLIAEFQTKMPDTSGFVTPRPY